MSGRKCRKLGRRERIAALRIFVLGFDSLVLLATQTLHLSTRGYGLLLAGGAIGSTLGGLITARIVAWTSSVHARFRRSMPRAAPRFARVSLPDALNSATSGRRLERRSAAEDRVRVRRCCTAC
jgi:hypothetical protein